MEKVRFWFVRLYIVKSVCIAFALCLLISVVACANPKAIVTTNRMETKWMLEDSLISPCLSDTLVQVLFSPDTVKCYHIIYKENIQEKEDVKVTPGYVRDKLTAILDDNQVAVLLFLLPANNSNYFVDSIKAQSPYFPILEFEFQKKGFSTHSIVLSPLNRTWQIIKDGGILSSFNFHDLKIINRFCNVFMNKEQEEKK